MTLDFILTLTSNKLTPNGINMIKNKKTSKNKIINVTFSNDLMIGVLALQGGVRDHKDAVLALGASVREVKKPSDLVGLSGLIIPGGESTTIGKLLFSYSLIEPIKAKAKSGMPIFGTCAGLIALAKNIIDSKESLLGLMDIDVKRNAFGRQVDSFEADIDISTLGPEPFRAVFIRAPWIESKGDNVEVLATINDESQDYDRIVMVDEGSLLACAFHPELTDDLRIHRYFIDKARLWQERSIVPVVDGEMEDAR